MGKLSRVRVAVVALAALFVALSVVAVSASKSNAPAAPAKVQLPKKTIGIMGPVDAAEIIKLADDATQQAARALGWNTVRLDPGGDPAKMAADMTSLVNQHVDAIVLTTMEPATIAAGLAAAHKAGIPVIDTHTLTHSSPSFSGEYFLSPPKEFSLLLTRMKKDVPRGSQIGVVGLPQFLNAKIAGDLIKAAAPKAGWKIVASHDADLANLVPDVQKAVGDMLRANPSIKAIFGCCDFVPTGAIPAIKAAGKKVVVYALHGVPSTVQLIKSGLVVAEMADYQRGGILAIDQLAAHFAKSAKISHSIPAGQDYRLTIVDKSDAGAGFPFPTSKVLAPFVAKWAKLYIKAK
jgi:ABC-type sugar transport system substrate-binding protein